MGASITLAGESLIAQKQGTQQILEINRFVLAYVPGLDTTLPIDRAAGLPPTDQIVHVKEVTQRGYLGPNQVVYSLMLSSDIGDFDFNYIGLQTVEDVLLIAAYVPRQQKRREIPPLQTGNNLTRNIVLEYDGAQSLTGITVPASSWQFDFTTQFATIDTRLNQMQVELNKKVDLATWNPPQAVSLDGPVLVYPGSSNNYLITDYSRFESFTATTNLGTVGINGDVLTLVVPPNSGTAVAKVVVKRGTASETFNIPVGAAAIMPPILTSPANLSTGVALDLVLTAAPFIVFPTGQDQQAARQWQIATDEAFTQIIFDKTTSTELLSIRPSDYEVLLPPGKRLYARARDIGQNLQSAYSDTVVFNTATIYIRRPAILFPTDGLQSVTGAVTILSDALSVYGGDDVHLFSRFQIAIANDGTGTVHDSNWINSNLNSYKPPANLQASTQYYVRVKYIGQALGESEWSPFVGFKTAMELTGIYTALASGATIRSGHSAVTIAGNMYIFGGSNSSGNDLGDLWKYNPVTKTWSQLASGASPRREHSAVAINGMMYVFGGYHGGTTMNDLWKYDPSTNVWTKLASGATIRFGHSAVVIDGKMYIFGGVFINSLYDLWRYDPSTNAWSQLASASSVRNRHNAVAIAGVMYVFGGNNDSTDLSDLWKYDPAKNAWSKLASSASARRRFGAVVLDGKMYVFGGYRNGVKLNDFLKYDPSIDTWSELAGGATVRFGHCAVVIEGVMYVFGGEGSSEYLNDLWSIA